MGKMLLLETMIYISTQFLKKAVFPFFATVAMDVNKMKCFEIPEIKYMKSCSAKGWFLS